MKLLVYSISWSSTLDIGGIYTDNKHLYLILTKAKKIKHRCIIVIIKYELSIWRLYDKYCNCFLNNCLQLRNLSYMYEYMEFIKKNLFCNVVIVHIEATVFYYKRLSINWICWHSSDMIRMFSLSFVNMKSNYL